MSKNAVEKRVLEAALRRLARDQRAAPALAAPARPIPARAGELPRRKSVIEAALWRMNRTGDGAAPVRPAPAPAKRPAPVPPPAAGPRVPLFTLEPRRAPADPRALAALMAADVASKLDQLCYVWNVIQELEPFGAPGEPSLRLRAAELFLVAGGGNAEVPLEGPLRAVRSFLAKHGMHEEYVERLCEWYLRRT